MTASYKKSVKDIEDGVTNASEDAMAATKRSAEELTDAAKDIAAEAGESMTDAKEAFAARAGSTISAVRDAVVEKADGARESLSEAGDRLAETLQRATDDGDALKSKVMTSVAQGLTSASDALRQRSVADLTADVKMLAKRHPGAFMAAAAVAGFAAARFVRSSARRRMAEDDTRYGQGPRV